MIISTEKQQTFQQLELRLLMTKQFNIPWQNQNLTGTQKQQQLFYFQLMLIS